MKEMKVININASLENIYDDLVLATNNAVLENFRNYNGWPHIKSYSFLERYTSLLHVSQAEDAIFKLKESNESNCII